jgi:hypothetical protein
MEQAGLVCALLATGFFYKCHPACHPAEMCVPALDADLNYAKPACQVVMLAHRHSC